MGEDVLIPKKRRRPGPKTHRPRRMMIRMNQETYEALFALAAEVGKPAASIVADHLEMNTPVFLALCDTVVASKRGDFKKVGEEIDKFRGGMGAAMSLLTQGLITLKKEQQKKGEKDYGVGK